ncbi:MAG: site-specific DNA-methyltransferase [Planctomycetota bacterium]|nr:MAG: site-specific DNA-methyltransferase [Planctomycetota bacterium]
MPKESKKQNLLIPPNSLSSHGKTTEKLGRLDSNPILMEKLLPFCRLKYGEIWEDPVLGHRIGVLDATSKKDLETILGEEKVDLVVNDPPYNIGVGKKATPSLFEQSLEDYLCFSRQWLQNVSSFLRDKAHLYIWMGAHYKNHFQPLPDFMLLMREFPEFKARNLITLRNQRGYGTSKNWMWVRQELLHYTKGDPFFQVVYTDIPKVLQGYYKKVKGEVKDNLERSKSSTIRPGNVWIDIQQVFYRMEENVPGCYAQKPLKAILRILESSSKEGQNVLDMFAHSGTTLLAGELLKRRVFTFDLNPVFAEITLRRLERLRKERKKGWQWQNPFPEIDSD